MLKILMGSGNYTWLCLYSTSVVLYPDKWPGDDKKFEQTAILYWLQASESVTETPFN